MITTFDEIYEFLFEGLNINQELLWIYTDQN